MTPEQALKEIDNLLSQMTLNRQNTQAVIKMIEVLAEAIKEK